MNLKEVGMVLARISNYDNRKLDASVAKDWQLMLDRALHGRGSVEDAFDVVMEWFMESGRPYFMVAHLIDGMRDRLRLTPKAITDDVRAAKSRGLVEKSWPRDEPLRVDVQDRLLAARAEARELAMQHEVEGINQSPLQLDVGRRV